MTSIGIIGAGVAGLHLGLFLRQQGIDATIYTEKTPAQQFGGQLPALVARAAHTRERERLLGVNHWDGGDNEFIHLRVRVAGEQPFGFEGTLDQAFIAVDMRIYFGRLLEDFVARGGSLVIGEVHAREIEQLAARHDLLVVATGRGGMNALFPRVDEYSPYDTPQRVICTGLFRGVARAEGLPAGSVTFVPEQGELFEFPIYSFEPNVTGLVVEAVPGSPLEPLARMRYQDDPQAFNRAFIAVMREHAPAVHERIDPARFGLTRVLDLQQGGITPTVRRGYFRLGSGKHVLGLGDVRVINDPITGQGANTASRTAWMLGEAICGSSHFDELFCHHVSEQIWAYAGPIAAWTNTMLQPPPEHILEFMVAAGQHTSVAARFARMFEHPVQAWELLSSPQRTRDFLRGHGWTGMPLAA